MSHEATSVALGWSTGIVALCLLAILLLSFSYRELKAEKEESVRQLQASRAATNNLTTRLSIEKNDNSVLRSLLDESRKETERDTNLLRAILMQSRKDAEEHKQKKESILRQLLQIAYENEDEHEGGGEQP